LSLSYKERRDMKCEICGKKAKGVIRTTLCGSHMRKFDKMNNAYKVFITLYRELVLK